MYNSRSLDPLGSVARPNPKDSPQQIQQHLREGRKPACDSDFSIREPQRPAVRVGRVEKHQGRHQTLSVTRTQHLLVDWVCKSMEIMGGSAPDCKRLAALENVFKQKGRRGRSGKSTVWASSYDRRQPSSPRSRRPRLWRLPARNTCRGPRNRFSVRH